MKRKIEKLEAELTVRRLDEIERQLGELPDYEPNEKRVRQLVKSASVPDKVASELWPEYFA